MKPLLNFFKARKLRDTVHDFSEALGKHLRYKKDLLSTESYGKLSDFRQELKSALKEKKSSEFEGLLNKGDGLVAQYLPSADTMGFLREQVEVILVAVVTALAIRAYFYQPFKIPTDSMKPTLYGIQSPQPEFNTSPPGWLTQRFEQIAYGRLYHFLQLKTDAVLTSMKECDMSVLKVWFDYTDLTFSNGETHRVWCSPTDLYKQHIQVGQEFSADKPVFNFHTDAGDQVLVNKWLFHFRLPHRGEVLVFMTSNIPGIEDRLREQGIEGSEFYIKRCVGLPGDTLQVKPPLLLINGDTKLENAAMRRVESAQNGYRGYGFDETGGGAPPVYLRTPDDTYTVPANGFWAMGDNSYDSYDSRFWGPVPRENIVGTGTLVWWPFTKRWGLIH